MRLHKIWVVFGIIFAVLFIAYFIAVAVAHAPARDSGTIAPAATATGADQATTTVSGPSANIYLIDLNGGSGPSAIGCGDATVAAEQSIPSTKAVMAAALTKLFSIKEQNVKVSNGEDAATYYNALYQSDLKVDSAVITNGVATVKISGATKLGGECDDPRAIAQIRQTVMQFPAVQSAVITLNGKDLDAYFSLK